MECIRINADDEEIARSFAGTSVDGSTTSLHIMQSLNRVIHLARRCILGAECKWLKVIARYELGVMNISGSGDGLIPPYPLIT